MSSVSPFARIAPRTWLKLPLWLFCLSWLGGCTSPSSQPVSPSVQAAPGSTQLLAELARREEAQRIDRMASRKATQRQGDGRGDDAGPRLRPAPDESLGLKLERKTRDLYVAQLELQLAEEESRHAQGKSADELQAAERVLSLAQAALVQYRQQRGPRLVAEGALKVARRQFSVDEATQNLAQMKEEYAKFETDGPAKRTGEIVVWRAETRLELEQLALEGAQLTQAELLGSTLVLENEKLEHAAKVARNGLRMANEAAERLALKNKLNLTRARNKESFLVLELEELREAQRSD